MKIGIFAKTFNRSAIRGLFQAIAGYRIYSVQFNLSCVGLEPLPLEVPSDELLQPISPAAQQAEFELSAISGTSNMWNPHPEFRRNHLLKFDPLCDFSALPRTPVITLYHANLL